MSVFDDEEIKKEEEETTAADTENVGENPVGSDASAIDDNKPETRPFSEALGWVNNVIVSVAAVLVLSLFLFRAIVVDGSSMCDTLQDGDRIITTNLFYTPSFGDIVVVQADKLLNRSTNLYGEPIVKRVIGVAGDTIRIDYEKGEVYRNGELLEEDYIKTLTTMHYSGWLESNEEVVVPEDCVFVMGDNRNVSHDSRDLELVGFVDVNLIIGKAVVRVLPISEFKWL